MTWRHALRWLVPVLAFGFHPIFQIRVPQNWRSDRTRIGDFPAYDVGFERIALLIILGRFLESGVGDEIVLDP